MNKIIIMGNVGADAECKVIENGTAVIRFSLATSETFKTKNGEKKTETVWHNCCYFSKTDAIAAYIKKGTKLLVEGSQKHDKYESNGEVKYYPYVKVLKLEFAGANQIEGRQANTQQDASGNHASTAVPGENTGGLKEDDLPF